MRWGKQHYGGAVNNGIAVFLVLVSIVTDYPLVRYALAVIAATLVLWPALHRRYKMTPAIALVLVSVCGLAIGVLWYFAENRGLLPHKDDSVSTVISGVPIAVAPIKTVDFYYAGFDRDINKDAPMFFVDDAFISNTSKERPITLTVSLSVAVAPNVNWFLKLSGDGVYGLLKKGRDDWPTKQQVKAGLAPMTYILSPLTLAPQETAHGTLVFIVPNLEPSSAHNFALGALQRRYKFALHLTDVVTGESATFDVPIQSKVQVLSASGR